jgi:hypothetical protein
MQRKQLFTIAAVSWLMLFKEIITAYNENHTKLINTSLTICLSIVSFFQNIQQIRILSSLWLLDDGGRISLWNIVILSRKHWRWWMKSERITVDIESVDQSASWEANSQSDGHKQLSAFCGTQRLIAIFIGPYPEAHELSPHYHTLFLIKIIFYKTLLYHNCISNVCAQNFRT